MQKRLLFLGKISNNKTDKGLLMVKTPMVILGLAIFFQSNSLYSKDIVLDKKQILSILEKSANTKKRSPVKKRHYSDTKKKKRKQIDKREKTDNTKKMLVTETGNSKKRLPFGQLPQVPPTLHTVGGYSLDERFEMLEKKRWEKTDLSKGKKTHSKTRGYANNPLSREEEMRQQIYREVRLGEARYERQDKKVTKPTKEKKVKKKTLTKKDIINLLY